MDKTKSTVKDQAASYLSQDDIRVFERDLLEDCQAVIRPLNMSILIYQDDWPSYQDRLEDGDCE